MAMRRVIASVAVGTVLIVGGSGACRGSGNRATYRRYGSWVWGLAHVSTSVVDAGSSRSVEPQTWKVPMIFQRTSVWLDVHARSVAAASIDGRTGAVSRLKMTPDRADILTWFVSLSDRFGLSTRRVRPTSVWPGSCSLLAWSV